MITAIQGTPISINLPIAALSSGWTVDGQIASHDACVPGSIYLNNYTLVPGQQYQYTYKILSISSGYVQAFLGTQGGAQYTTAQYVTETITANGSQFSFFSNGVCSIELFSIAVVQSITSPTAQNTMAFSQRIESEGGVKGTDKWMAWYTYIPDSAFSIFTDTFSFYQGAPYFHEQGSFSRGIFYGIDYGWSVNFSTNEQPTRVKTFLGLNYQANQLLLPPSMGINTSLGQVSQLYAGNFLQAEYNDGTQVYAIEGMFKSAFLRDMTVDITNGDPLRGNWLQMSLGVSSSSLMGGNPTSASTPAQVFSVEVEYAHSAQNIR